MMEDYRAGLGIDRAHDDDDLRAGRKIGCPVLFLWAAKDDLEDLYGDPLEIWRDWAGCARPGDRLRPSHRGRSPGRTGGRTPELLRQAVSQAALHLAAPPPSLT